MLEFYFKSPGRLEQLRSGPLAEHISDLAAKLYRRGFTRATGQRIVSLTGRFNRFAAGAGVEETAGIDDALAERFINEELRAEGTFRDAGSLLRHMLDHLRSEGVIHQAAAARPHPHVHALVTRGGWTASGEWVPVPYVDERAAEELFRHKVLGLLRRRGLLSEERIELLLSWRRSGFSVHNRVYTRKGGHDTPVPPPSERAALRRRWANLIRRVYETDPLVCPRCGAEMRVIGFITEPGVIRRIVDHLRKRQRGPRPPPRMGPPVAVPAAASPVVRSAPC